MPRKREIPAEVQAQAEQAVCAFDEAHKMLHQLEFKRGYAYLSRIEKDGVLTQIGRLSYLPQTDEWDFTVYKYSTERYDAQEWGYPGREFLDGTLTGVLQAGLQIYPPTKISKGIVWQGCLMLVLVAPFLLLIRLLRAIVDGIFRLFRLVFPDKP